MSIHKFFQYIFVSTLKYAKIMYNKTKWKAKNDIRNKNNH